MARDHRMVTPPTGSGDLREFAQSVAALRGVRGGRADTTGLDPFLAHLACRVRHSNYFPATDSLSGFANSPSATLHPSNASIWGAP